MGTRKPKPSRADELRAELERQRNKALELTPENIANGHLRQLELLRALETHDAIQCMCARQVGKTEGVMGAIALIMKRSRNAQCLYLGLNDEAAKEVFETKWKPFCERFQLPAKHVDQITTFTDTGSRVVFGGLTHAKHAASYLGKSMAGGICAIDESQDQPGLIELAIKDTIGPMLSQRTVENPNRGKLLITGTCPAVHAGYSWDLWRRGLDDNLDIVTGLDAWLRLNFSRFDNVHLGGAKGAREDLDVSNATLHLNDAHPIQQRNFFGNYKLTDATVTAFRYDQERNSYSPPRAAWSRDIAPGTMIATDMPADCDTVHVGVDPGAVDRFSVVWWYSNSRKPTTLWMGGEWVTPRNANAGWNAAGEVLDLIDANVRGGITHLLYDAGGSKVALDLFSKTVGRRALTAASKTELFGRVERLASLLGSGNAKVIRGSETEKDLQSARWDQARRAVGKHEWSTSAPHPDPVMAALYACDMFWQAHDAAPKVKTPKTIAEEENELFERAMRVEKANATYGPQSDDPSPQSTSQGGYGPPRDW